MGALPPPRPPAPKLSLTREDRELSAWLAESRALHEAELADFDRRLGAGAPSGPVIDYAHEFWRAATQEAIARFDESVARCEQRLRARPAPTPVPSGGVERNE